VQIKQVGYGDPDASKLISEVQQEYVVRYGGPDSTPVDPAEFTPPSGLFLVGYLDGLPVASGGWRSRGDEAEIKRMYVTPTARHRGLAQPEAIALYRSSGYTSIAPFGHYAGAPGAIHLGKPLRPH
jgi:hypothetical protein